jgi:hypothetical protein
MNQLSRSQKDANLQVLFKTIESSGSAGVPKTTYFQRRIAIFLLISECPFQFIFLGISQGMRREKVTWKA